MKENKIISIAEWEKQLNQHVEKNGGIMFSSSGSTGNSKNVIYDNDIICNANRRLLEVMKLTPLKEHSKIVMLWGYGLFPPAYYFTRTFSESGHIVYPLGSGKNYPTELKADRLIEILPDIVIGMPSYIIKIGELLIEKGYMDEIRKNIKFFVVGGEVLTEILRKKIENMYGCRVYDNYGMLHIPMIAAECEYSNIHLSEEFVAEVLKEDGTISDEGIGTLLLSSSTVSTGLEMNRVNTEDIVELRKVNCACGCKTKSIRVLGRSSYNIKVKGNTVDLQLLINDLDKIEEIQGKYYLEIIKNPVDEFIVHIDVKVDFEKMKPVFEKYIHFNYKISRENNITIPTTQTGKQKKIIKVDLLENKEHDII